MFRAFDRMSSLPTSLDSIRTSVVVLALASLACSVVSGCMSPYERGSTLYESGDFDAARKEIERGLERAPEDPQLNLLMARILVRDESYRPALSHAKTARQAPSTRGEGAAVLGDVYWGLERPGDAVEAWREARDLEEGRVPDERYRRALERAIEAADAEREFEDALAFRLELREIAPDHSNVGDAALRRTREKLAESRVERGEYGAAAELYATLSETAGGAGNYAYERGRLLLKLDRTDTAVDAFETYVSRAENASSTTERLERVAEAAASHEAPRVALQFYERAIQSMQDGPSFRRARLRLRLARLQFDIGRSRPGREQVRAYLEDMRQLQGLPLKAEVYIEAADIAREAEHGRFAAEILQKGLDSGTSDWQIVSRLAEYYAVQSRPSRVESVLETYVEQSDAPADAFADAAQWARNRRNYDLAEYYYERLLAEAPERSKARLELARVYAQLGRIDQLRATLETFVRRHDGGRRDLFEVVSLYIEHKLYGDAEEVLEDLQASSPTNLVVADRMAKLYRSWNKPERVHDAYRTWIRARGEEPKDYQLVGERMLRRDKRQQALPYFRKAAEKGVVDAWLQIADIYKDQRREVRMKEALDAYVEAADNRAKALRNALNRYQSTSRTEEKIDILEELIELEPDLLSHYKQLGLAYLEQGRIEPAFQLWRQYVGRSDSTIESLRTISSWFEQSGRADLVLSFYQHWLGGDPDPRLYRLVGDAYLQAQSPRARFQRGGVSPPPSEEARDRARSFYDRYLEEADPNYHQLRKFAVSMRHMQMWSIAARAYRRLKRETEGGSVLALHLGQSLLHLGRTEEGITTLKRYYRAQGKSVDSAERIADYMIQFELYDRAEPFLRKMFESNDDETLQAAFVQLTDVYLETGRTDAIGSIVTDYLGRTSNPTKARKLAVRVLSKRGLYGEAATQIERIRQFQGDVMGFEWGENLFRAGRFDEAREAFREHASNSPYTAAIWLKIGNFYESHARSDWAMRAYDRAAKSAPDDFKPFEERGRFRTLSGQIEAGRKDFREALDRATDDNRARIRKTQVQALRDVGHFQEATELARRALENVSRKRSFFLKALAKGTLPTADAGRTRRLIDRLASSSLPLIEVVDLLMSHDYRRRAAEMIENELETGSPSSAARAILQHPTVFTRLRGLEGLKRVVDPILDKRRSDSFDLRTRLGEFFIRQGDYENGVLYLRSSRKEGGRFFGPMLAQTYLLLDQPRKARRLFQHDLARISGDRRSTLIRHVGMRYELLGRGETFRDLLELWSIERRFTAPATRLLMHALVSEGRTDAALERLRRLAEARPNGSRSDAGRPGGHAAEGDATLVSAFEAMASEGYDREVRTLLDGLSGERSEHEDVESFRFHLSSARSSEGLKKEVESLLASAESPARRRDRRLKLARILMVDGHYQTAAETARPGLEAPDPETVRTSAQFLMRNAFAAGDVSRIDEIAETYRSRVPHTLEADLEIGRTMQTLGLDDRAVEPIVRATRQSPTQSRVSKALEAIRTAGDVERARKMTETVLRIGEKPLEELRSRVKRTVDRQGTALSSTLLKPYRTTYGAELSGRLLEARIAFRAGEVERGRTILKTYLREVEYDPLAVERVLTFLDDHALDVEMLNVVERPIDREARASLTPEGFARLGYAHLSLDRSDRGTTWLDRAIERSNHPTERAVSIARTLYERDHYELARTYADEALSRDPDRPDAHLTRGLAALALGDIERGRSDLERGLEAGINRLRALSEAGRAALAADRPDLAERYLLRLARTPNSVEFGPLLPMQLALSAYIESGDARRGVAFLSEYFPRIAAGDGVVADEMLPQLSTLYEKAGMTERAFELYRTGIRREQIQNPAGSTIPVYLNNLAYTYSTSNRHVDRGFDLVRRAIAASSSRQPSYIDTFGWLLYRRGDLERAERYVRRSLRSAGGSGTELMELYDHLVEIRQTRGDHEEAFWLKHFSRSLERQR